MNIDIHIPDEYLTRLADMVAERLQGISDDRLGAFLENKPAPGYPAPADPAEEIADEPVPAPKAKKAKKQEPITLESLRARFQALSEQGHKPELLALLHLFDARTLPKVAEDNYPELAAELDKIERRAA